LEPVLAATSLTVAGDRRSSSINSLICFCGRYFRASSFITKLFSVLGLGKTVPTTGLLVAGDCIATSCLPCGVVHRYPVDCAFDGDRTSPAQPLNVNTNMGYAMNVPSTYARETYSTDVLVSNSQSQSQTHTRPTGGTTDVLTICAGTQTDPETSSSRRESISNVVSHLADKNDLREILGQLEIMRQEQQQLRRLCESLVQQQQPTSLKTFKETSSQCEIVTAKSE